MVTDQGHPLGVTGAPAPRSARQTINDMLDAGLLDELMDRVDAGELTLTGEGGFLPVMVKAVLERGLQAELTEHLGYIALVNPPRDRPMASRLGLSGRPIDDPPTGSGLRRPTSFSCHSTWHPCPARRPTRRHDDLRWECRAGMWAAGACRAPAAC